MIKKQMKQLGNMRRKMISFVLIVALVMTGMNLDMMSQSIYAAKGKSENEKRKKKVTVVKELTEERTENSNTYLLSDGSKKTEIHSENIRYKENGKLVDYDTTLEKLNKTDKQELNKILKDNSVNDYTAVNTKGDSKQYFPKELNESNGIVMNKGKYMLSFVPIFQQKENNHDIDETKETSQKKDAIEILTSKIEDDTITYESENSEIKYEYISLSNGVKENIILSSKPETNEFTFRLDTKKLDLELLQGDGGINLKDIKTGKTIGYIMPPNITDAEGNVNYEDVKYKLEKTEKGIILKLEVKQDYFNNKNLVYPVQIDPTPVWFNNKLATAVVCSASVVSGFNLHSENLYVNNKAITTGVFTGSEQRVYLDTSKVAEGDCFVQGPGDICDKYIEQAELCLMEADPQYEPGTVEIREAKSKWNPQTITWNNQPEIEEEVIGSFTCEGIENSRHIIDLTEWAQGIADGEEDTGFVFTVEEGKGGGFKGPEVTHQGYMWLSITYRDISAYDASVELSAEYNSETGKIETKIADQNELSEGTTICGYKMYERKNASSNFNVVCKGEDISDTKEISPEGADNIDLRACILYSDGTVRPSNIVTLKKMEEIEEENEESGENTVTYEQTTIDTDGDGLEDGYEIWDFKTLWNTETGVDEEGNKTYDLDTDKDGFPDSYEVFTLGTDPAVENEEGKDSDEDGWSDLIEYQKGTDPWLKDSDFDGTNDKGDSSPRKTSGRTKQTEAAAAQVQKGLYDREYSETESGVTSTYITNIYRGDIKQVSIDYGDVSMNKVMKYFYDEKGNNTAIIEAYDESYDPKSTKTICITYTYDTDGNVTFICDQSTKYTMTYANGEMTELKVGNNSLVQYGKNTVTNNAGSDSDTSGIEDGGITDVKENITTYGNKQSIRTKTTNYKRAEENTTDVAAKDEIYYNGNSDVSYVIEYNNAGQVLKFTDHTDSSGEIIYNYSYTDNTTKVTRNDGFIKEVTTSENEDGSVATTSTAYTFKDLKNNNITYTSVYQADTSDESKSVISNTLFNGDKYTTEVTNDEKDVSTSLYSDVYDKNILKVTEKEVSNIKTTFDVDIYAEDKAYEYTYDLAGNITSIKELENTLYEYTYDAHGRLTGQKDYTINQSHEYIYNATGNIQADWIYQLDDNGKISGEGNVKYSNYNNEQWPDQLSSYDGKSITYDNLGNPIEYWNGMKFQWTRGRQLEKITLDDNSEVTYQYNQDGLRTHKETNITSTDYEWDENKLIREIDTYKSTGKKYDIWYFFDSNERVAGFEYSEISDMDNSLKKNRVYYEKNLQGDVIGLLDSRGAEIAKYAYDAWGNVTSKKCYEGYETPFALNHITYRGYYQDDESGFYYLQSRYYDAEVGRFLNADDVYELNADNVFENNKYIYAFGNPVNLTDPKGKAPKKKYKVIIMYEKCDFAFQAICEKNSYIYGVAGRHRTPGSDIKLVDVKNAQVFKKTWNNDCATADYVSMIVHGGAKSLGVGNDAIANSDYEKDREIKNLIRIKKLKDIHLKELRLYSCNAAIKEYKKNVAQEFRKNNHIKKIYACDGSVSFSTIQYGSIYVYILKPRLAYNQTHFYEKLKEMKRKKRAPQGFYWIYK